MIFWVEMQKARRRHDLLLCLLVPLIILLWVGRPVAGKRRGAGQRIQRAVLQPAGHSFDSGCLWQWGRWPAVCGIWRSRAAR